jgi:hypothetical protein
MLPLTTEKEKETFWKDVKKLAESGKSGSSAQDSGSLEQAFKEANLARGISPETAAQMAKNAAQGR